MSGLYLQRGCIAPAGPRSSLHPHLSPTQYLLPSAASSSTVSTPSRSPILRIEPPPSNLLRATSQPFHPAKASLPLPIGAERAALRQQAHGKKGNPSEASHSLLSPNWEEAVTMFDPLRESSGDVPHDSDYSPFMALPGYGGQSSSLQPTIPPSHIRSNFAMIVPTGNHPSWSSTIHQATAAPRYGQAATFSLGDWCRFTPGSLYLC